MNLMDLFVKISVDDQASSQVETLSGKLKSGLATAAKVGASAVVAAGAAIVAIGKQAVEQYAEYEQLVGGAELMFGDAYDFVAEKAKNAYSAVQMSQNEYLKQVNGFATGLKTALGGNEQAAAELADKIISAEADVVAATGNSQEAVQNAFNGIMKSNYTMLDNLQIGITPTKEGFQEVIDKVNEWNAANGRATNYVIDNLADAQSALVDYIEMQGLQGYAANEAADTIQGSLASMKGAWKNLLTGVADDNANFEVLVSNFVDSLVTAGENIIPRVKVTIQGVTNLISQASQSIVPLVLQTLIETAPSLISAGMDLVMALIDGISSNASSIGECIMDIISVILNKLSESIPELLIAGVNIVFGLVQGLIEGIPAIIAALPTIITELVNGLLGAIPQIIQAGITLLTALVGALPEIIQAIVNAIPLIIDGIINAIVQSIPLIIQAGIDLLMALIAALPEIITAIVDAIPQIISGITDALIGNIDKIIDAGVQLFVALIENLPTIIVEIVKAVPDIIAGIVKAFGDLAWKIVEIGGDLIKGIWEGIKNAGEWLWEKITGFFDGIVGGIKDFLGIHSPSRVFADMGKNMALGIGEGWDNQYDSIKKDIESGMNFTASVSSTGNVPYAIEQSPEQAQNYVLDALKNINFSIYLDGKTLVGKLAPTIDEQMGTLHIARARGV